MKVRITLPTIVLLFFATIVSLSSCGKRRELRQLGCVRGRVYIGTPVYSIGPMTKKEFFLYLDSPNVYVPEGLIQYDMTWKKIDSPTECPIDI